MKKLFASMMALGISVAVYADEAALKLKTTSGNEVEVAAADMKAAYEAHLLSGRVANNSEKAVINDDGSVTIHNPFFRLDGVERRLHDEYASLDTVCVFFGFAEKLSTKTEPAVQEELVNLTREGTLAYSMVSKFNAAIITITCRK